MSDKKAPREQRAPKKTKQALESLTRSLTKKEKTPAGIVRLYNEGIGTDNGRRMENILYKLEKRIDLGNALSRNNVNMAAKEKMKKHGINTVQELRIFLKSQGVDASEIPDNRLYELIALDDWSTVWQVAKPLIAKYGPQALNWVHAKAQAWIKNKRMGGDEGFESMDWGGSNPILGPRRITLMPGVNVDQAGIKDVESLQFEPESVSALSIKAIICPELFKYRYAYISSQKVALAVPVLEFSVVSSSTGNVGVVIYPRNYLGPANSFISSGAIIYNDASFSVNTGTQAVATTNFVAGSLASTAAVIDSARVSSTGIQFIPTASFNTAGSYTMAYTPRNTFGAGTATMATNLSQVKVWPYVTSFNNKTMARMVAVTGDGTDDSLVASFGFYNQVCVLFGSGLPPSVEVGRFVITQLVEFIPTQPYFPVCAVDFPYPGPMTEQFETLMFTRFPVLQQLDLVDAKRVADSLGTGTIHFKELAARLDCALSGIQPRQYHSHGDGGGYPILGGSDNHGQHMGHVNSSVIELD